MAPHPVDPMAPHPVERIREELGGLIKHECSER